MTTLLISAASVGFGAFMVWAAGDLLERAGERQRNARLLNLLERSSPSLLPLRNLAGSLSRVFIVLGKYGRFQAYLSHLGSLLVRSDVRGLPPAHILGYQVLCASFGGFLFGVLSGSYELTVFAGLLGTCLPYLWLRDKALLREKRILRDLPGALEALALCSEAGLTLEQGLDQYLRYSPDGPLRDELGGVLRQARAGSSRQEAYRTAAERLKLQDFTLFTTSVIQAEKFGTGVAKTLRQLSMTLRDKQSQRAEKAVHELPVKLLLPLVICIMPVTFLVLFGPIVLQFLKP